MNNFDDNPIPALAEIGGEPLLGSGFEGEQSDADFTQSNPNPWRSVPDDSREI